MPIVWSIRISDDPVCRALAADVARRYAELAGAPEAQVATIGQAVAAAVDAVADGDRELTLDFTRDGAVLEALISCATRREHRRFQLES
jgi:hypothetical protein